jgi:hypothetical protein
MLEFLTRETKGIQIGKEEVQLSLLANDMILYLKDLKSFHQKLLDLINTFGNLKGYKLNMQKSVDFLYTNNEHVEKEIRKTNALMKASKI